MKRMRSVGVVAVGPVLSGLLGCPSVPSGGGGGNGGGGDGGDGGGGTGVPGTNINRSGRAPAEVEGFFAADEPWAVGSPTFLAFGTGDFVDFMTLTTESAGGTTCVASTPAVMVSFADGVLSISSLPMTDFVGVNCSINVSIDASVCAPDGSVFGPPNPCFVDAADGEIRINGSSNAPGEPRIVRFQDCDPPPFLSSISQWGVLSVHPFALPFISDPEPYGAVVLIEGGGAAVNMASVVTGVSENEDPLGCVDESTDGSITLINGILTVDLTLGGQDNDSGFGSPGGCAIRFSGTVTSCEIMDPTALGGSGATVQLMRFDGEGEYEAQNGDGQLNTLYFSFQTGTGGSGLPGGVRVKGWLGGSAK